MYYFFPSNENERTDWEQMSDEQFDRLLYAAGELEQLRQKYRNARLWKEGCISWHRMRDVLSKDTAFSEDEERHLKQCDACQKTKMKFEEILKEDHDESIDQSGAHRSDTVAAEASPSLTNPIFSVDIGQVACAGQFATERHEGLCLVAYDEVSQVNVTAYQDPGDDENQIVRLRVETDRSDLEGKTVNVALVHADEPTRSFVETSLTLKTRESGGCVAECEVHAPDGRFRIAFQVGESEQG